MNDRSDDPSRHERVANYGATSRSILLLRQYGVKVLQVRSGQVRSECLTCTFRARYGLTLGFYKPIPELVPRCDPSTYQPISQFLNPYATGVDVLRVENNLWESTVSCAVDLRSKHNNSIFVC